MKTKKTEKIEMRSSKFSKLLDDKFYWYIQYGIMIAISVCIAVIVFLLLLLFCR